MPIKKQYSKTKPVCKVTFRVPKEAANSAQSVHLVGEFNNWDPAAHPMKKLKSGEFTATIELQGQREYQFRYLIGNDQWQNDSNADKYIPTQFGDCENSVVVT